MTWNSRLQMMNRSYEGYSTIYDYDDNTFELTKTTSPDGVISEFAYDPRGRLQQKKDLNGRQICSFEYNIEPGNNFTKKILSFNDASYPDQISTTNNDGLRFPPIFGQGKGGNLR